MSSGALGRRESDLEAEDGQKGSWGPRRPLDVDYEILEMRGEGASRSAISWDGSVPAPRADDQCLLGSSKKRPSKTRT